MKAPVQILLALLLVLGMVELSLGDGLGSGIATPGSPHNFADDIGGAELPPGGWNAREEVCRVCHVPHDHNRTDYVVESGLLWNHALSNATFTMYSSETLDGAIASQPTGISKMCLGCHDGTTAVDTFDSYVGGTVFIGDYDPGYQVPGALFPGDLGSTHPISIEYDEAADPGLRSKNDPFGASGTIGDILENGTTLQCSSCHDVHDAPGESVPGTHLLRVAQKASQGQASGLCISCHIK